MKQQAVPTIEELLEEYNNLQHNVALRVEDTQRASGGIERSLKGEFVEHLARSLIQIAWNELGGNETDIKVKKGSVTIPLKVSYLERIQDQRIKEYIQKNLKDYTYTFRIDVPVYIKGKLVMAVECKAYAENAMLKRILFDGSLIKQVSSKTEVVLFQLESQLGGDYSDIFKDIIYGSTSTHTLMSHFDYELHILTLLEGERKVERPIHKPEFFKPLKRETLENVVQFFQLHLKNHISL